jgi:mono/diheme cytochrome c family protein
LQHKIVPLIVLSALLILGCAAQAQDPSRRGRAILKDNCGRCHAIGKTGASPMAAAPPFRTLGSSFELDAFAADLQRGILAGHPDMPEFRFGDDDARAVVAYLRTIQP